MQIPRNPGDREPTPGAVSIRAAVPQDAEALLAFKRQALGETEFLLQGLEDLDDRVESERELISRFASQPHCILLIATLANERNGRVVGLCSIVGGHLWRTRHVGTMSVAVLRHYWNQGIAGQLMHVALQWALGNPLLEKLSLQVHASNQPARRLYQHLGFAEEGRLRCEARLGDGYDDLVAMGLLLHERRAP